MNSLDSDRIFHLLGEIEAILERDIRELREKPGKKDRLSHREKDLTLVRNLKAGKNHQFGFLYHKKSRNKRSVMSHSEKSNDKSRIFRSAEEAAEAIAREDIPEPPEGADPDIWYSISPEVHQEASQVARVLLGKCPPCEDE